jgi:hydroxypyruvate reductase
VILSVGKAAPAMALGATAAFDDNFSGLIVTTDGTPVPDLPGSLSLLRAAHPIPDSRSVVAANTALHLARSSTSDSLLVLISGGTSSLLCAPKGLSLNEKRTVTDHLLRSGASIRECNTVRRHLSAIKGGRLGTAFRGKVHCVILSDVVGGEAHDVGSGPAVADPSTMQDADRILRRYLPPDLVQLCSASLDESIKPSAAKDWSHAVLASPADLARTLANHLGRVGLTMTWTTLEEGTAEELSEVLLETARGLLPGQGQVIASEPTLRVPQGFGRGGRAGWVALNVLSSLPPDVTLFAAASDGVDGNSGSGGACVDGEMKHALSPSTIERHLSRRDDAAAHEALGSSLRGEPTGLNLTDVFAVLRAR